MEIEISVQDYAELRKKEAAPLLLDCREPLEYEMARIEGGVLMPMGDVPSRAHQELDPDEHIVVVCHHGQRSLNVALWLRQQGFENAQSLSGGIEEWARTIDPMVPRY
ncbi:MAG TPA: rhodanese-like domain-containing protein [Acidobacteriaceae bacterium]|jgi:rhodanese-related sulfurtransferase|nr:rhodanese-like domain-containing protein [Acidobacteriaceae bacterium]